MNKKNKGFSLVELIVVVAIMAVLVGVLAPSLLRYVEKTRIQKDASAIAEVAEAITIAAADETAYGEIAALASGATTGTTTVTVVGDGSTAIDVGSSVGTSTKLRDELRSTIGTITFSSTGAPTNKTVVITITKQTDGTINTEVTTPSGSSDWETAIIAAGLK